MKILCVSTLTNVGSLHYKREMTYLQALRLRGAKVEYVYCDGMDGVCDGLRNIDPRGCVYCRERAVEHARETGLTPIPVLAGETAEQRREAARWAAALTDEELPRAVYGDYPIGMWCFSSVLTHWRIPDLTAADVDARAWFRALLEQGLRLAWAMDRLLDRSDHDAVFLYNARMAYVKIPFELARRRGLSVYTHERGWYPTYCIVGKNTIPYIRSTWYRAWEAWKDTPLTTDQIVWVSRYLRKRRQGDVAALNWYVYSVSSGRAEKLRERLGISPDKAIWALFTSSTHEFLALEGFEIKGFVSQSEWIEQAVIKAAAHPRVHLVIRTHPNLSTIANSRAAEHDMNYFSFLKRSVGAAATVIEPGDDVSSYDLMDLASVGLCYMSTCGLEMAAIGKPVAIASNAYYDCLPTIDKTYDPEEMERVFARYAALPPGHVDQQARRMAYRLWFASLHRWGFAFPYLHYPTPISARYAWFSPDHLRPGRDGQLDLICDTIFSGDTPFLNPDPADLERATDDEDAFFGSNGDPAALEAMADMAEEPDMSVYMTVPVVFMAVDKPSRSAQSLNALAANALARDTDLHVIRAAGHPWRSIADLPEKVGVFKSVTVRTAREGEGLLVMVLAVLDDLLKEHESIIVLDDGLYCARHALTLLNTALFRYRYRLEVGCVCAASSRLVAATGPGKIPEMVFAPEAEAMGFGLWRDRWEKLNDKHREACRLTASGAGAGREGLARVLTRLCADLGALCAFPSRAHASHIGPEGAAVRRSFAALPDVPDLPFAPDPSNTLQRAPFRKTAPDVQVGPDAGNQQGLILSSAQDLIGRLRATGRPVLANIGCGRHFHEAWINLDMLGDFKPVIPWNLLADLPLPDGGCDAIYSCHSLEHFHPLDARRLLAACLRALRPGGVLRVVVPDLEDQARTYLRCLDEARRDPDDSLAAARHDWMTVELVDQLARHESGGMMMRTWTLDQLPAEAFIAGRMGREYLGARETLKGRCLSGDAPGDPARVGAFRLGGEVHQWMYDEASLGRLLLACGFREIRRLDAWTSDIPDFAGYGLDVLPDGEVYRPASLYMEARP